MPPPKWDWLAAAAGPGTHVVRLSYGRGETPQGDAGSMAKGLPAGTAAGANDGDLLDAALRDASALLTVPVTADDVLDWDVVSWARRAAVCRRRTQAACRRGPADLRGTGGLAVVGGWLAGNGLAAVVADTRKQVAGILP